METRLHSRSCNYPTDLWSFLGPLLSTSVSSPTSLISITAPITTPASTVTPSMTSDNIFQPIETGAPPSVIGTRDDHPVPRLGIQPQNSPIGTNKFYANFFLGSQSAASWTHPYSVAWSKGGGSTSSTYIQGANLPTSDVS